MNFFVRLAWASAWNRRLTLGLMLLAIALSACLLLAVERLRQGAEHSFAQSVSGTDLIVGARGSPLQLLMYAVFHQGEASQTMSWASYQQVAQDPRVAWALPLSLGDSHRGFPVLGTESAYFQHFRYGLNQGLAWQSGRAFQGVFEAVLGAEVAERLGYRLGDAIVLSHGLHEEHEDEGPEHDDKPFTITGILAPTGTPVDRTVHVSLDGMSAIHLEWQGGVPMAGVHIPADSVGKFDLHPQTITAALVGLKHRADALRVQRHLHTRPGEALQAILPGVVLAQLWQSLAMLEKVLQGLSGLILVLSLASLVAVMLASLGERRRELAILRALGASVPQLGQLLLLESALLGAMGAALGLAGLLAVQVWAGPWLAHTWGVSFASLWPSAAEWQMLLVVWGACAVAGLIPAWQAGRMALHDGLNPRL